jgi:multiple sugar transport system substrate-binding protein
MGSFNKNILGLLAGTMLGAMGLGAMGLGAPTPAKAEDIVLKMAVPDWPPTRIMKELADKYYKAPSGNHVTLEPDFIPWPDYYTRLNASLTSGEKKYQMAVSDSQWLGAFVDGGYYMKLNQFIDADPDLQAVFKDLHPNLVAAYSTYPHKSQNYYGFPQMPDVLINYYRKDVFCDAGEQKAFQEKFGYKLPCDPAEMDKVTWDQWGDFGKFFQRKKGDMLAGKKLDDDFYGISYQAGKGYDMSSMQVLTMMYQDGDGPAGIWDETKAPDSHAQGVVNSPTAVKSFEHFLQLLEYMPPVAKTGTMDIFKTDELFREGKVASNIQWIGFAESTINPDTSKVADKVDFAMIPGTKLANGKLVHWANIGGQPFVITTWNSDTVTKEALAFCKWWLSSDTQKKFAQAGGQSGLKSVYSTPEYLTYRPWNRAFGPSLDWQLDVWHVPPFFELLVEQQEEFDKAITGQISAKDALDTIADFQENLLQENGLIK